jgi:hypothetical protein
MKAMDLTKDPYDSEIEMYEKILLIIKQLTK